MRKSSKLLSLILTIAMIATLVVSMIPAASAAETTLTLCTGTLNAGDKVVIATADKSKGVTGQSSNDATIGTDPSAWVQYTVEVVSGGYAFKSGSNYIATASSSSNNFKYSSSAGVMTVKTNGQLQSNSKLLYINANNGNPVCRFYKDKTSDTTGNYTPMYVYVVTESSGSGTACEHEYSDCTDTTCNKCDEPRAALTHKYDDCEDTTCNNCTAGNRTAPGHAYTNEYDAKCNNCTKTRTVTLPADGSTIDLVTADKIGAAQDHNTYTANKYYVTGTVKTVGSTKYGNITIEDEDGNTFYLYTVKDNAGNLYEDVTENKPVVGAEATFYGPLGRYNSTTQMNPAVIYVKVESCEHEYTNELDATCDKCGEARTVTLPAADSTLDFATITKLGLAQGHNNYTSSKYYFVGTIKAISNTQYGNMTVEDEDGNVFTVYGSYDSTGATSFGEMAEPFKVGDKVKVYGIVGQYNGTAQIKNGWLSAYTAGSGNGGTTPTPTPTPNPDTNDSLVAYIAVAVVALFGLAYVSKKH